MADKPLINGIFYDFAQVTITVEGEVYQGVTEISYKNSLKPGKVRGTHAQARARTTGQYEPEASLKLHKDTANLVRAALGAGYMTKTFGISVSYAAEGADIITDEILNTRISEDSDSHSEGTDGLTEDWTLDPWRIIRNGLDALPNMF
jgi:hypothetical protein